MSTRQQASTALKRLMTEYKQLTAGGGKSDDMYVAGPVAESDFFTWECLVKGPDETPFENGIFVATLTFPRDYPLNPPKMRFTPPLFHPNSTRILALAHRCCRSWVSLITVYANGEVCISILHSPGDDPNQYESSSERWSPVQSVDKVLLSVVSMLAEPNIESGANVDASKAYRTDRAGYEASIRAFVRQQLGVPSS
ncbi:uncharacterized protein L969DRAFT_55018 [Mixia osmundae IAM 14324]|uniref:uncharacterized protein n=1 Tax=Mixia osmundae (strain CBS 9802 / IAM 14324 / JCM 22182 / KY 12970) TaxID=764103 RepID=UPI0004A54928|nr:uncharacterized protein L969DRAFT_55018 [Mixia osmundae IAM 14324]KEI36567.1 hypothetical protein L969DRAFT_55018 [Mixia osmundae IAM 14324]